MLGLENIWNEKITTLTTSPQEQNFKPWKLMEEKQKLIYST